MQANAHPELSIFHPLKGVLEVRVYNKKCIGKRANFLGALVPLCGLLLFGFIHTNVKYPLNYTLIGFIALSYIYNHCTQVIYESAQIIAFHGIQLETARGIILPFLSPLPITSKKRFIPITYIQDIVINEGLRRWNVRYYLCIIKDTQKELTLEVIFENLLPRFPVLEIVYRAIHDKLDDLIWSCK